MSDMTTVSFRVDRATREVISAVAYADLVSKQGMSARPGDVNLSEFVRNVIDDVVQEYASEVKGGLGALVEEMHAAHIRNLEEELEVRRKRSGQVPL